MFEKIKQNNIKAYVAYCYRYIPSVNKLKKIINNKEIGKILSYRLIISSYLPDWHPWEDYRSYYMAKKEQGGGAIYDESHGIDLVRWLFDDIKTVYAEVGNISELEISADDVSILITNHYNGIKDFILIFLKDTKNWDGNHRFRWKYFAIN